eukprot:1590253-Amphidinium_carterae.1
MSALKTKPQTPLYPKCSFERPSKTETPFSLKSSLELRAHRCCSHFGAVAVSRGQVICECFAKNCFSTEQSSLMSPSIESVSGQSVEEPNWELFARPQQSNSE